MKSWVTVHPQLGSLLLKILVKGWVFDEFVSGQERTRLTVQLPVCDWTLGGVQQVQVFLHKHLMSSVARQLESSSVGQLVFSLPLAVGTAQQGKVVACIPRPRCFDLKLSQEERRAWRNCWAWSICSPQELYPMGVNCFLWGECSSRHCLPEGSRSRPRPQGDLWVWVGLQVSAEQSGPAGWRRALLSLKASWAYWEASC